MKNFKLSIFSTLIVLLAFTSCTNEETIIDTQQNTEETAAQPMGINQAEALAALTSLTAPLSLSIRLAEACSFIASEVPDLRPRV